MMREIWFILFQCQWHREYSGVGSTVSPLTVAYRILSQLYILLISISTVGHVTDSNRSVHLPTITTGQLIMSTARP